MAKEKAAKAPKAPKEPKNHKPKIGGPNGPSDGQLNALAIQHLKAYERDLAAKKLADARFKNTCKLAKAEMGEDAVETIKDMILVRTPEGEATIKGRLERMIRAARWMAVPIGAQANLFDPDRRPATDRAFDEGKLARLQGEAMKAPYDPSIPQHDKWLEGYHQGDKDLIEASKRDDAVLFDAKEKGELGRIGDAEATHEELVG